MQLLDGGYVYSATDLNNYLECEHLVALERRVAQRLLARPQERDQTAELIRGEGGRTRNAAPRGVRGRIRRRSCVTSSRIRIMSRQRVLRRLTTITARSLKISCGC